VDPDEQLAVAFKKVTIPGFRKALKEEDRFAIAREHFETMSLGVLKTQNKCNEVRP
jgi:hypothetical protein